MLEAIDLIESLADDNTILVPGHGTLVHKKDLLRYRAMLVDLIAKVNQVAGFRQIAEGRSGDEHHRILMTLHAGRHRAEQGSFCDGTL